MVGMNIFDNDAFSAFSLTQAVEGVQYKPQRLSGMGLVRPNPVRTNVIGIERRNRLLSIIPFSPDGSPPSELGAEKRNIRNFNTVHIAKGDTLNASEIAAIRAFGSESELQQARLEVGRRTSRLRDDFDLTKEHMLLGMIQGKLLDADASVKYDWFSEFEITEPNEIDFDLDNSNPAKGALRKKCTALVREMTRASQGAIRQGATIHAMCGDAFWDDLTNHSEARETYLNQAEASQLREGNAWETFRFGGITWENYRGTDDNSTVAIGTDKVRFFPTGAQGVFDMPVAPIDTFEFVNTPGREFYVLPIRDKDRNMWWRQEMYSRPLPICVRPEVLQRGRRT